MNFNYSTLFEKSLLGATVTSDFVESHNLTRTFSKCVCFNAETEIHRYPNLSKEDWKLVSEKFSKGEWSRTERNWVLLVMKVILCSLVLLIHNSKSFLRASRLSLSICYHLCKDEEIRRDMTFPFPWHR